MKLLSYQPFSLYSNGGGSRILRRLYEGREESIISLAIVQKKVSIEKEKIKEVQIEELIVLRSWMRWKLRDFVFYIRRLFKPVLIKSILNNYLELTYDILHIVDQGNLSSILLEDAITNKKEIWVSFHDHFLPNGGDFKTTQQLWNKAHRRLVISHELGREYQRIFNDMPYEVVTDGVKKSELSIPKTIINRNNYIIYFAGLLHIDYLPLFQILANVLDDLSSENLSFTLILRGTQKVDFLDNRNFKLEYMPMTLDNNKLKAELEAADILYLPLKFTNPEFYLFSLSTKMIGYLAASGTILFHGPSESAACKLLQNSKSAIVCNTLKEEDLIKLINKAIKTDSFFSKNAKKVIQDLFILNEKQNLFWRN